MSEVKKSDISFKSADGINTIAGYFYVCPQIKPRAILQISHGMCEYIGRYDDFAAFMARNGFVVCGNDHLGHGASVGETGTYGYFGDKDGRKYVLQDLHRMNSIACKQHPGLPVVLLGHSMGSFFARLYAVTYPETLQALLISGTGGPNPLGGVGILLTDFLAKLKGPRYRSVFINRLAFGAYLKRIESPATPYDWITSDARIVRSYAADSRCTFVFTVSAFHELMSVLDAVNKPAWAEKVDKQLPVLLFSGDMDPVGDYGKGVEKVYHMLKKADVQDVELRLYRGGRHEMLNEVNREEVYRDVLAWCNARVGTRK